MQEMFSLHETHSAKRGKDNNIMQGRILHMKHCTLNVPNVRSLSYPMQVTVQSQKKIP